MNILHRFLNPLVAVVLAGSVVTGHAADDQRMDPGMMGQGMMYQDTMEPGMMYPGMMHQGMMHPGLMRHGMMGPGVMGPGMMGMSRTDYIESLALSDDQIKQVRQIREQLWQGHAALRQKMWEQQQKLSELYMAEQLDTDAIGKTYDALIALKKDAFKDRLEAEKRVEAVLTPAQREQLQNGLRRWRMMYR